MLYPILTVVIVKFPEQASQALVKKAEIFQALKINKSAQQDLAAIA
jgi:soluble lytic murein transglycosylase